MDRHWNYWIRIEPGLREFDESLTASLKGYVWTLMRARKGVDHEDEGEEIASSSLVHDTEEMARRDALEKLSLLRCPIEQPLDRGIRWMLEPSGVRDIGFNREEI